MLSCSCSDYYDYYVSADNDYSICENECKCDSCKDIIKIGDTCLFFNTFEYDDECFEIESEDNPPFYFCENCADIYLNLANLGYCIEFPSNMKFLLEEYQEITGFKK